MSGFVVAIDGPAASGKSTTARLVADRLDFVYLDTGADLAAASGEIRRALGDREVIVQSNRALRQISLEVFDRTFLITGVLGPGSNAHGPNEFLHLPMGKGLTCCVAHVIARHYEYTVGAEG